MVKKTNARKKGARKKKRQYSAPALEKGLEILELLCSESNGQSLTNIADRLGRTVGEIFRMLMVLEQNSYVKLTPDTDQYVVTLKLFQLSHKFPPINRLITASIPEMRKLADATEQSCHLVVYSEGVGLVIAQQNSLSQTTFGVRLGTTIGIINTCSGHLILAYASIDERAKILATQTPKVRKSLKNSDLNKIVEQILKQGHERHVSEITHGVHDIGCPVFDSTGEMIAALSIPFLERIDGKQKADAATALKYLKETAINISRMLGYSDT